MFPQDMMKEVDHTYVEDSKGEQQEFLIVIFMDK